MIERKFIKETIKEFEVQEFIKKTFEKVGLSDVKLQRTPLGEKIVIYTSRPGLVVGKKGENIKKITPILKKKFEFENPQIEIAEVQNPMLDAKVVAEQIASGLERYGIKKFKAIGHKTIQDVLKAGALGIEIIMSGKVPSQRAKSWRFYSGYLKKCGDIADSKVSKSINTAQLKSGIIGIQVRIMPADTGLLDKIIIKKQEEKKEKENES